MHSSHADSGIRCLLGQEVCIGQRHCAFDMSDLVRELADVEKQVADDDAMALKMQAE